MKTQLTIDLRSVAYCSYYWRNQFGETIKCKPRQPTVHGQLFNPKDTIAHDTETLLDYATRTNILDRWTPVCVYQFRNSHSMTFTGENAKKKHNAYNKHIYG